jgi:hypothetical protein
MLQVALRIIFVGRSQMMAGPEIDAEQIQCPGKYGRSASMHTQDAHRAALDEILTRAFCMAGKSRRDPAEPRHVLLSQ